MPAVLNEPFIFFLGLICMDPLSNSQRHVPQCRKSGDIAVEKQKMRPIVSNYIFQTLLSQVTQTHTTVEKEFLLLAENG